jgi:hypothetical protein
MQEGIPLKGAWVKKPTFGRVRSPRSDSRPRNPDFGLSFKGKGLGTMFEDIFLLVFCFILAMGGSATVVWGLVTGRFFTIDGLWLALISLTLSVVFGGNIAWSIYTGELQRILHDSRKESSPSGAANETAAGHK